MTAVVGIAHRGRLIFGADSALTDDDFNQLAMAEPKVFKMVMPNGDEMLIGGSGSARGGQLLRFKFKAPKHPRGMDADAYMASLWIDELRSVFKSGGHMGYETESENDRGPETSGTNALIGYRGDIWIMYGADLQVERLQDNYAAIGSGAPVALASLFTTEKPRGPGGATRERVRTALEAACRYNAACRPPFTILAIEPRSQRRAATIPGK